MLRKATRTNLFRRKPEEGQNPYIGFVSFQHFRGEKLYSDIVVKPEKISSVSVGISVREKPRGYKNVGFKEQSEESVNGQSDRRGAKPVKLGGEESAFFGKKIIGIIKLENAE